MSELAPWRDRPGSGLIKSLRGTLDRLPLGERVNGIIDIAEDAVVDRLRDRLELAISDMNPIRESGHGGPDPRDEARKRLAALINQANSQTLEDAQQHLYLQLLSQLVPDEARILSAMADGRAHAMIHVAGGPPIGPVMRRVLDNYSYVGRSASVRLEDMTPQYLDHLIRLGLVETGPEDKSLEVKYEVMANDKTIRALGKKVEKEFRFPPRILRRTIFATQLGRDLWHDCAPDTVTIQPAI